MQVDELQMANQQQTTIMMVRDSLQAACEPHADHAQSGQRQGLGGIEDWVCRSFVQSCSVLCLM